MSNMSNRADPNFQEAAKEMSRGELKQAVIEHLDNLYGFALSLTKNPDDAKDMVQETCLKALRASYQFEPGTNMKAWLFTILRNTFFNEYRRKKRSPEKVSLDEGEAFSFYGTAHSEVKAREGDPTPDVLNPSKMEEFLGDEVYKAVNALPEEFREAIYLCDVQELSYAEIAKVLDIPIGTVRSRLSRGRSHLQKSLWDYAKERGLLRVPS